MPCTVDWCETINKYMKGVHLKPIAVNMKELGEDFNPTGSFDRSKVIYFMKKVAAVSSQNYRERQMLFCLSQNKAMKPSFGQKEKGQFQTNLL